MSRIRIIGDDVLRKTASEVKQFNGRLAHLAEEMIEIMHSNDGIGLAAPQIGVSERLLVVDISPIDKESKPGVYVNPQILEEYGECVLEEGCLSIPNVREEVSRPEEILLKYQTVDGEQKIEKYNGWMARVLQHEIDHLNGVLFIDYLSPVKRKLISQQLTY